MCSMLAVSKRYQLHWILQLGEAIVSRAVFVIVPRSDGQMETLWESAAKWLKKNVKRWTICVNRELMETHMQPMHWAYNRPHVPATLQTGRKIPFSNGSNPQITQRRLNTCVGQRLLL